MALSDKVTLSTVRNCIGISRPRERILLTFTGICTAFMAGNGQPSLDILLLTAIAILLGSAGHNGLTNYIDSDFDAKMKRAKHRALPSKRIYTPEKVLPLLAGLVVVALVLAWRLYKLSSFTYLWFYISCYVP